MSVSYYAFVVYGLEVTKDLLTDKTRERGCNHPEIKNANFCSACGAPMWVTDSDMELDHNCTVCLSYFSSDYNDDIVVLGFSLQYVDDRGKHKGIVGHPTPEQKKELKQYCKKMNIQFEEHELKTHLIMYCSY